MSDFEEEPYSTMFASLKHPVRRKILRMLSEKPRTFSEMLEDIQLSSSHLTYRLESLGELVSKTDDGVYKLSAFGEVAVGTMKKVEETPRVTGPKRLPSLSIKWKYLTVTLLIGIVVLAGLAYTQYQSLNRLSEDYGQLTKLIDSLKKGASIQYQYELRYNDSGVTFSILNSSTTILNSSTIVCPSENVSLGGFIISFNSSSFTPPGNVSTFNSSLSTLILNFSSPWYCTIYTLYDNCTLHLTLQMHSISSGSYMPLTVQRGSAFDLETDEIEPVIWSANATMTGDYSIFLASKGWYTISLVGPIPTTSARVYTMTFISGADCSTFLSITQQGTNLPFLVMTNDPP